MPMKPMLQGQEAVAQKLHRIYLAGKLRLLVGAGLSAGTGFPEWDAMNRTLLSEYIAGQSEGHPVDVDELYRSLGRDAVPDFVSSGLGEDFHALFSRVFYGRKQICDLRVRPVHRQLAALTKQRVGIYTTNYDPLIELALSMRWDGETAHETQGDRVWRRYRMPEGPFDAPQPADCPRVEHLHGWVDPCPPEANEPDRGGTFILTESDYLELASDPHADLNNKLRTMLAHEGATLILGMSLADPNLRRLLYLLTKSRLNRGASIYAVLKGGNPIIEEYLSDHWRRNRQVNLLIVKSHDDIPGILRDIQWGVPTPQSPEEPWIRTVVDWVDGYLQGYQFEDAWQTVAFEALCRLRGPLMQQFGLKPKEHVEISLFLPGRFAENAPAVLYEAASTYEQHTGAEARRLAAKRTLGLIRGKEEGIVGLAFRSANIREALATQQGVDLNFTPAMRKAWQGREWRSILAIPIVDTDDWLPVAVMALTSDLDQPFWARLPKDAADNLQQELFGLLRRVVKRLLVG